jgi:hypothetical protein
MMTTISTLNDCFHEVSKLKSKYLIANLFPRETVDVKIQVAADNFLNEPRLTW